MTIADDENTIPAEQPDECHECGEPVWSKGESGYYDLCDDCYEGEDSLEAGDPCPNCGAESYGDYDAICKARAGNLMCRHCGHTFPNKE